MAVSPWPSPPARAAPPKAATRPAPAGGGGDGHHLRLTTASRAAGRASGSLGRLAAHRAAVLLQDPLADAGRVEGVPARKLADQVALLQVREADAAVCSKLWGRHRARLAAVLERLHCSAGGTRGRSGEQARREKADQEVDGSQHRHRADEEPILRHDQRDEVERAQQKRVQAPGSKQPAPDQARVHLAATDGLVAVPGLVDPAGEGQDHQGSRDVSDDRYAGIDTLLASEEGAHEVAHRGDLQRVLS
eukprot:CAMPEP_0179154804 /NCGR_PEP_ID=MMETSP0796-20121207/75365_1 /TAXON_ID=73915 /ORGANISM="Pyrodinium bahamense, Strain pbaha01" /LENGTH=247 /DNA_ID=CAMNT_0020856219 /DNA_START=183 /DNA_END=928 /DNA_ORIENTATION=-